MLVGIIQKNKYSSSEMSHSFHKTGLVELLLAFKHFRNSVKPGPDYLTKLKTGLKFRPPKTYFLGQYGVFGAH